MNKIVVTLLCFFLGIAGCVRPPDPTAIPTVKTTELQNAEHLFNLKKYSDSEKAYRKILTATPAPTPDAAAEAQYAIAFILAYYDNPQRNYVQSIREIDDFLRLYPDDARVRDAQNLRFILKSFIEMKKENEHLSRSIEELKKLDVRHEERRKGK